MLVRDHTSKAIQPKYKDFCIVGLLGKNQIEIKDNHGHTTKVHHGDIKKIPITEKFYQLYKEEQVGKVRNSIKAIPDNKMPDLGWDATEELEIQRNTEETAQEAGEIKDTVHILPGTIISIAILILTFLETIMSHIQEIPEICRKTVQAVTKVTRTTEHNTVTQKIAEIYRKAAEAIT